MVCPIGETSDGKGLFSQMLADFFDLAIVRVPRAVVRDDIEIGQRFLTRFAGEIFKRDVRLYLKQTPAVCQPYASASRNTHFKDLPELLEVNEHG